MTRSLVPQSTLPRIMRAGLLGTVVLGLLPSAVGCLDRPVAPASPLTSNTVTKDVKTAAVDKIDLLFMIDNSASMADKQFVLSKAVPDLVGRLINPACVTTDASGKVTPTDQQPASLTDPCPTGSAREFNAINDIHIGVVTSSLGGHGADICQDVDQGAPGQSNQSNFTRNDHAHLINRGKRPDPNVVSFPKAQTWNDAGFLAWDPTGKKNDPPGEASAENLKNNFTDIVIGADQIGCGYEASLEAWYRFLIEPNPPAKVSPGASVGAPPVVEGTDDTILQQRADFLRPDSLVAVIVLSDENDCSVIDGVIPQDVCDDPIFDDKGIATDCKATRVGWPKGYVEGNFTGVSDTGNGRFTGTPFPANYLLAQQNNGANKFRLKPPTAACKDDPSSPDCQSCYVNNSESQCSGTLSADDDTPQLRCWNTKQRFGWDALYPLQRYVDGLTLAKVYDRNGFGVTNPLFDDLPYNRAQRAGTPLKRAKFAARDKGLVFFATIVGVPWQDLARDPKNLAAGYKPAVGSADEPNVKIDWDLILGDPFFRDTDPGKKGRKPTDPLMIETNKERDAGTHPVTGEPVGSGAAWNSINGHEWKAGNEDLQYACIFPLTTAKDCSGGDTSCDCGSLVQMQSNPLCEPFSDPKNPNSKGTGMSTLQQYRAKGYPGTRFLQVAKDIQGSAIVASICAANLTDPNAADFGYRPAVSAIIDRLKTQLKPQCFSRQLAVNPDNTTPCLVIDAKFPKNEPADPGQLAECKKCADHAREPLDTPDHPGVSSTIFGDVKNYQCLCVVKQFAGNELTTCQSQADLPTLGGGGWCYVDPNIPPKGLKNAADIAAAQEQARQIVDKCPANEKHTVRFIDANTENTTLFITCLGAASGTTVEEPTSGSAGSSSSGAAGSTGM